MAEANPREERAAKAEVDPDRLLQGEDPRSSDPSDAQHWFEMYSELVAFKERMVKTVDQAIAEVLEKPASHEIATTDRVALAAELARFRRRLEFWKRRGDEIRRG
jgi:hypothetical protein